MWDETGEGEECKWKMGFTERGSSNQDQEEEGLEDEPER